MKISKSKLPYAEDPLDVMYRNTMVDDNYLIYDSIIVIIIIVSFS